MEQNLTRIFTLFGGLALFLYGMDALSHSLETAAGSRLKSLLERYHGEIERVFGKGSCYILRLREQGAVKVI